MTVNALAFLQKITVVFQDYSISFEMSIHVNVPWFPQTLNSTMAFNMSNKNKCFLSTKSAN